MMKVMPYFEQFIDLVSHREIWGTGTWTSSSWYSIWSTSTCFTDLTATGTCTWQLENVRSLTPKPVSIPLFSNLFLNRNFHNLVNVFNLRYFHNLLHNLSRRHWMSLDVIEKRWWDMKRWRRSARTRFVQGALIWGTKRCFWIGNCTSTSFAFNLELCTFLSSILWSKQNPKHFNQSNSSTSRCPRTLLEAPDTSASGIKSTNWGNARPP